MSTNVEIRLTLKDKASAALKAVASESERLSSMGAKNNERMAQRSAQAFEKMSKAREVLGVRSEHAIQREIQRTEASYNRLARSGEISAKALGRAQEASIFKIKKLRQELSAADKDYKKMGWVTGGVAAAGLYGSAASAKRAVDEGMNLDERLALRANAAFRGKSFSQREAGITSMRGGIDAAVSGGLTVNEAVDTLDELIAKNQVGGIDKAIALLPKVARFKAGQGGSPVEAASLISTLMGGDSPFAKDQAQAMRQLDMIAAAGGAGAFETSDLAKHLPNILALAKTQGYVGDSGLKRVLVMLEQGMTTAGSADESANNLRNLFSKMNSDDTAKDFKKMGRGDLSNTMLKARAAGKTPDEVYLDIINQETKNNPKLREAMKKVALVKDEAEREERIKAVNELAKGTAIGKLFQDMQAKGAFLALLNEAFGKEVAAAIDKSNGVVDQDAEFISQRTAFKSRVSSEQLRLAEMSAVEKLNPLISQAADMFSNLIKKNPELMGALALSIPAITGLGAAALYSSTQLGAGALASSLGTVAGGMSRLATVVPLAAAAFAGWEIGKNVVKPAIDAIDEKTGLGIYDAIGRTANFYMAPFSEEARQALKNDFNNRVNEVNTTLTVKLADGLKVTNQSTTSTPTVKNIMRTGNAWGIP